MDAYENNVIKRLNEKPLGKNYWIITILATLGGFLFGYGTSNIGSAMPFMPFYNAIKTNSFIEGYLVAGASLGAAAGAIVAAFITERLGRKGLLISDATIYAIGAAGSALSVNLLEILIFRTFIGIAVGADSAIATSYIAEFAPKNKRGHLTVMQQMMIVTGILSAFIAGILVYSILPSLAYAIGWRILLGIAAVPALIGLVFRLYMPESPRWLILHEKYEKAISALKKFGIKATIDEVKNVRSFLLPIGNNDKKISKGVKRALIVGGLFAAFTQATGINIPLYYGPILIDSLHLFPSIKNPVMSMVYSIAASAILASLLVISTYIGLTKMDSFGRRHLALLGFGGMVFSFFLGMILYIMHIIVGILIGLGSFLIFFGFGVGANVWVLQSEYFPAKNKGFYISIIAAIDWLSNFVIIELFPVIDSAIGIGYTMGIFGVLSAIAFIIVYRMMPFTKGMSIEDVPKCFANNSLGKIVAASKKMVSDNIKINENKNLSDPEIDK